MSFDLTAEEQVILLSSRLNPSREDIGNIEILLKNEGNGVDYDRLIKLASLNGVAPFLYKALKKIDVIPPDVIFRLKKIYLTTLARNTMYARDTLTIRHLLKEHDIEAIPLKGALASQIIFGDPGLYISGDIDFLVKPSELDETKKILLENDYHQYDEKNERAMLSSHYHLVFQNERHAVEVHWNLVKRYFHIPPEFWWEDTFRTKYEEEAILCLSHERYLMYLIYRLFSHQFLPLKFFVLTSELININHKNINWKDIFMSANRYGMKRLIIFTLLLMNELLNTKIPVSILKSRMLGYNLLKKSVINELFRESRRPYIKKIYHVFLLDTPLDMFKGFLKRFFPEKGELRLRYKIPENSRKIYLYYILNPLLLPFLILRKRI